MDILTTELDVKSKKRKWKLQRHQLRYRPTIEIGQP